MGLVELLTSQRIVTFKRVAFAAVVVVSFTIIFIDVESIKRTKSLVSVIARVLSLRAQQLVPILAAKEQTPLILFVGIFSAPRYLDRRNAVRQTWGTRCKNVNSVACWFITDGQDVEGKPLQRKIKQRLDDESRLYGDILFAQSPAGMNFGRRYLWMIQWASERYTFEYLLRVDDDYFICLEKLLSELALRPKRKLAWGWLQCTRGECC